MKSLALMAGVGAAFLAAAAAANAQMPSAKTNFDGSGTQYGQDYWWTNQVTPEPAVSANVSTGAKNEWVYAESSVDYYFAVSGPGALSVPVSINYTLSVGSSSNNSMRDRVEFWPSPNMSYTSEISASCGGGQCYNPLDPKAASYQWSYTYSGVYTFDMIPGDYTELYIYAGASAIPGTGSAHASVDPVVTIDPTWLKEHPGYSLEFSPGVGNGAIPEPATWTMMILGAGLVGAGVRWRRAPVVRRVAPRVS